MPPDAAGCCRMRSGATRFRATVARSTHPCYLARRFTSRLEAITMATGSGTKADPWVLKTPPGTSEYQMYRDDTKDPAVIVCVVASTTLGYQARAVDDLHAILKAHRDWMPLRAADAQKNT